MSSTKIIVAGRLVFSVIFAVNQEIILIHTYIFHILRYTGSSLRYKRLRLQILVPMYRLLFFIAGVLAGFGRILLDTLGSVDFGGHGLCGRNLGGCSFPLFLGLTLARGIITIVNQGCSGSFLGIL